MLSRITIAIVSLLTLALGVGVPCVHAGEAARIDERNRKSMLEHLRAALHSGGAASRFYYEGCWPGGFPRLKLQTARNGKTGLAAVQKIFKKNRQVVVEESRSGIIRIHVGKVPTEILRTKIRLLTLKPEERYNPELALIAISGAKDVEAAMRALGLEHEVVVVSIHVQEPRPGLPHLPPFIRNVTLDEAYDLVAKTFAGIVIYNVCKRPGSPGTFDADFAWR